ncbi:lipopolysaccharide heptosyltransferase RfaC [Pasteurellaceae bacterium HPA106]|uniref:lipopolysaccharide heptosyltransferase RfaC n=1 Tax=Spirabiliibacterium pneumoniae TaxID=221400 RepID=UPI001AAD4997|nr:lipopolysaccharide heptosyltransferase RfaC [Spirabiliibacterium pneumoniae]MBE2897226.1 lipopolysaccharide heptosyltransferase RfaC [Spirabiliibacterium pneumoniae]
MKVCIVKTSSMGDILHTLPALTDAQQAIDGITFDWVVEEDFIEIPFWHTAVDHVIKISLRRWRKSPLSYKTWQEWRAYRNRLRETQYDAVIDAQGLFKSAFFATRLIRGTKHGYDRKSAREPIASFFYDKRYDIAPEQHAVERTRALFASALGYSVPRSKGNYGITQYLKAQSEPAAYCVFIHSTTRDEKHWHEDYWRDLIARTTALGVAVKLPWGNERERERAERLAAGFALASVLSKSSLSEMASILANALSVVAVDTGLSHLTAALDVPCIGLYGATDPKLIGSYGNNQIALTASSMQQILPDQVWNTLIDLIDP